MHGDLTAEESERYSRQIRIPEVGAEGQLKLKRASVLLIGTGALGSPAAMYLAAAGVGRIGLVDDDVVDVSNLQRQILHGESWRGLPKLESAVARLQEINPLVKIDCYPQRFGPWPLDSPRTSSVQAPEGLLAILSAQQVLSSLLTLREKNHLRCNESSSTRELAMGQYLFLKIREPNVTIPESKAAKARHIRGSVAPNIFADTVIYG